MLPRVIITDRDLALINACEKVFPNATRLLCRWHISQNILKNCRQTIKEQRDWDSFLSAWKLLEDSPTWISYVENYKQLQLVLRKDPRVLSYVDDNWLNNHKEKFVSACLLRGFISNKALDMILGELHTLNDLELNYSACGCQLRNSCGLPCACELLANLNSGEAIPLDSVDIFWRTLDVSWSTPLEHEDIQCDDELHIFKETFNKQSNAGKKSLLRKLGLQDVKGDGNCGFRSVAVALGLFEDQWPRIRSDMVWELEANHQNYKYIFGTTGYKQIYKTVRFAGKWMEMPNTGFIIASAYNRVVISLANGGNVRGCTTTFPLWSIPPQSEPYETIVIAHVYGNHFIKAELREEYKDPGYLSEDESSLDGNNNLATLNRAPRVDVHEVNEKVNSHHSDDPFGLYDLLRKSTNLSASKEDLSLSHPLGFTPVASHQDPIHSNSAHLKVNQDEPPIAKGSFSKSYPKASCFSQASHGNDSSADSSTHVSSRSTPKGGSILEVLDDMIKSFGLKRILWDYISGLITRWNGETIVLDDFNEVRSEDERESNASQVGAKKVILDDLVIIDKNLDKGMVSDVLLAKRMDLNRKLHDLKQMELKDAAQKAKVNWAIEGDENSKFFHGVINKRRSQLAIRGVFVNGDWYTDPSMVKEAFLDHFTARFKQPSCGRLKLNMSFPNRLSFDQVGDLDKNISIDEIRKAVWDCGESKSPGPDGFTFEFFRRYWHFIGPDFCAAVNCFFDKGRFPRGSNSSFIALIPKVKDAKFVTDFRPISLIGSVYKVVTKIVANRLTTVISGLISNTQSAFVVNRHILDGPFYLKRVRWDFLLDVLLAFGFGPKWCQWIRGIFSSNMASILINGSPSSECPIFSGLKQGDPLAPFLFILVMESLHLSVTRAVNDGIFKGLRITGSSSLSHLFYVDDAVFIGEWSIKNLDNLLKILNFFHLASGLCINVNKSHVLGVGVPLDIVHQGSSSQMGMAIPRSRWFFVVGAKKVILDDLVIIDKNLDKGMVSDELLAKRIDLSRKLYDLKQMELKDAPSCGRLKLNMSFPNRLSSDQVGDLDKDISIDEIRKAVWDYGESKLPGPDGFTFEFFRRYWQFIGPDFCATVNCFFDKGRFLRGSNSSFIALIPKVMDAKFVTDFRPISLIGSVYKVVTKILANRLTTVISDLISNTQSASVANRHILDGPFILNEVLAWCKRRRKQALVFKVDFAKAYDSVRWDFLLDVLLAFGFGPKCLKQGDPLAHFLFILVMESLHLSVTRAVNDGIFKGLRITGSSSLSHLFYADDAVFIGEWSIENLDNILKILNCFHLASGLCINMNKSHVLGVGVPLDIVRQGALRIGCEVMQTPFKYLGVIVGDHMSRYSAWSITIQKVRGRLTRWKGGDSQDSKITWVAWANVLSSKKNGGLRVSSFFALNRALLLKWGFSFLFACRSKRGGKPAIKSLHLSVTRAVNDGIFKGLRITGSSSLSHPFYADDAVFIGEWSIENLDNLLKILNCFHLALGLCINVYKSHVLGVGVPLDIVRQGALRIGCKVMQTPFKYLGVMVGDHMSHYSTWSNTIQKVHGRLSRIVKSHGLRGRRCYRLRKIGVLEYLVFSPSTGLFFSNGYGDTSFKMVLCGITSSVLFTVLGWSVTLAILSLTA
nr:RNA-directed DNA polymerase, eukaryota [Tanacetum cinerariifolium]